MCYGRGQPGRAIWGIPAKWLASKRLDARTALILSGRWYLHDLTDGFKAERGIGDRIDFYNTERPHSALAGQTPAEAYGAVRPVDMMDKAIALPTSPQGQQPQ